ncbi:MAG: hypothetical protein KGZ33_00880 [Alkaliphilus sp.]|nr:hypothetical protein [Alkaliphilus sp.]
MRRLISFLVILLFAMEFAYANDAVLGGKGNTVYPIYDTSVKMLGENVSIKIVDGRSYIRCEFLFINTGKSEKLMVGFPAYGTLPVTEDRVGFEDDLKLYDFKAYVNGKEIPVTIKKGLEEEGNNKDDMYYPNWYVWELEFEENEIHRVVNTYWVKNSYDSMGGQSIDYVLRTGSTWKGNISYGKITMELETVFDPQDIVITNFQDYKDNENIRLQVLPEEKKLIWEFYDLEPDFDIGIYISNLMESRKQYLLSSTYNASKEMQNILQLGKQAYNSFQEGELDNVLKNIREIEEYKNSEDRQISEYALQITNWLDYYRAKVYLKKGDIKKTEYYLKASGILEDRNHYKLTELYKTSGNMDKYMQSLKKIMNGRYSNSALYPWAIQQFNNLPESIKVKYNMEDKIETTNDPTNTKEDENTESNKFTPEKDFSARSFVFINMGIFILILVVYWNIKKRA